MRLRKIGILFFFIHVYFLSKAEYVDESSINFDSIFHEINDNIKNQNLLNAWDLAVHGNLHAIKQKDTLMSIKFLNQKSIIQSLSGDYSKSIECQIEAIKLTKIANMPNASASLYHNIAIEYKNIKDYKKSLFYSYKGLDILSNQKQNSLLEGIFYISIASVYLYKNELDSSLHYLNVAKSLPKNIVENNTLKASYNYCLSKYFIKTKQYKKSMKALMVTINIDSIDGDYTKFLEDKILLSKLMYLDHKYEFAIKLYNQCLENSIVVNNIKIQHASLEGLYKIKLFQNDSSAALNYLIDYNVLNDSLNQLNGIAKIKELEFKNDIENLELEKNYELHKLKLREEKANLQKILMVVIFLFTLLILAYIGYKKNIRYKLDLSSNKREILLYSTQITQKNKVINQTIDNLENSLNSSKYGSTTELKKSLKTLKFEVKNQSFWKDFEIRFKDLHEDYSQRLITLHPELSKSEIRLCAFLKLNFSSKEISEITNKTVNSINVTKHRIKAKMNLDSGESLYHYIAKL